MIVVYAGKNINNIHPVVFQPVNQIIKAVIVTAQMLQSADCLTKGVRHSGSLTYAAKKTGYFADVLCYLLTVGQLRYFGLQLLVFSCCRLYLLYFLHLPGEQILLLCGCCQTLLQLLQLALCGLPFIIGYPVASEGILYFRDCPIHQTKFIFHFQQGEIFILSVNIKEELTYIFQHRQSGTAAVHQHRALSLIGKLSGDNQLCPV